MIVNIHGPSGSGKTTLIRHAIQANKVEDWFHKLTDARVKLQSINVSLSTMPIPKFRGAIRSYFDLFGVDYKHNSNIPVELQNLLNTILPHDISTAGNEDLMRLVETLSAGEERRLAILRCLIEPCQLRIIDEPYANSSCELHPIILKAIMAKGNSILLTHDPICSSDLPIDELVIVDVGHARLRLGNLENE